MRGMIGLNHYGRGAELAMLLSTCWWRCIIFAERANQTMNNPIHVWTP
jgi:hypothetical protein